MVMVIILVAILLAALGVSAWMWIQVQQGAKLAEQAAAVPLDDVRTMQPLVDAAAARHQELLEQQRLVYEDRLREMREELKGFEAKAQEGERVSADLVGSLRGENEALKAKILELQTSSREVDRDSAKIDHLIVENSAFRAQIAETSAESNRLKGALSHLEQENQRLKTIAEQTTDAETLVRKAKEEYQRQLDSVYRQVEELRTENTALQERSALAAEIDPLRQMTDELTGKVRELEMVAAIQAEKNEYLQYELTKSRAQVVGLERVCENAQG